jgi:hypothetical protein
MKTIIALYLFVIFKFNPSVIDNKTHWFWRKSVKLLNKHRKNNGDAFYLVKLGRLYIRDPHAYPSKDLWTSSKNHPFCWYIVK